jgi:outer membrane protein assembly factor BamB/calcineurin-like phosphoesterase family protein
MRRLPPFLLFCCALLLQSAHGQSATVRFAWLSDTHIGSTMAADDLYACVRDINADQGIGFVIVSGDVTELGSDGQLTEAKHILDELSVPYHIVPGNHDTKWSASGTTTFSRLWGSDTFVFDAGAYRFIGMHQGPRMRMGNGHWAPEDRRWLDSIITRLDRPDHPLIMVTHYPIDSSITNWFTVLDRLQTLNTVAVLVGHGHANRLLDFEGIRGVMGRSSLRAGRGTAGYTMVTLSTDSIIFAERTVDGTTHPPHCALSTPRASRATHAQSPSRPDFSVNDLFPGVRERWHVSTGWTIGSSPAADESLVVVGDASGAIRGFRLSSGVEVWHVQTGGPVYSTAAVFHQSAVLGSADGTIYCIDTRTGRERWRVHTDAPIVASPVIHDTIVYIGGSDHRFRAIDLLDGHPVWNHEGIEGFVEAQPLVAGGKVLVGAWDGALYALDARTGEIRWRWKGGTPGVLYSPAACTPVESRGIVFIVAPDRQMTAIGLEDGRQLWRTGMFQVRETIGRSADGDRIYIRTMRDSILALAPSKTGPEVVWCTNAGFGYDINSAAIVEGGNSVFYGTKDGIIIAVDARSGGILWKHRTGAALCNTILPLPGGDVIVADADGVIEALSTNP